MLSTQKKILIAGYYGFKNIGDEAILSAMLASFRAIRPELDFIVISGSPEETAAQHHVQSIPWANLPNILEVLQQCDLIILGGGGLFMDYWRVTLDTLLTKDLWGNSTYSGFPLLAKLNNKPCMIYSVGVGPLFSESGELLTRMAFELADAATVRDNESFKLLEAIGVECDSIQVSVDPAFGLPSNRQKASEILAKIHVPRDMPVIGVCLRNWNINISPNVWQQQVAAALDQFVETQNAALLFVPSQVRPEEDITNDLLVAKKVISLMRNASATFLLQNTCSPECIAGILAQCELVVGMRLHSLIFGLKEAVPCVGIIYDPKVKNTMTSAGMDEYAIELNTLTSEKLYDVMRRAWANKAQIRTELKGRMEELKEIAAESAKLAIQLLDNPSRSPLKPTAITYIQHLALEQIKQLAEKEKVIDSLTQSFQDSLSEKAEKEKLIEALTQSVQALSIEKIEKEGMIQSLAQTVQRLSIEKIEIQRALIEKQQALNAISAQLAEKDAELNKIKNSLGWRLLSRYGRIKYRYLLPIYRLLGLAPTSNHQSSGTSDSERDAAKLRR